jgi:tetratricopeptide (TPR) repeat protein
MVIIVILFSSLSPLYSISKSEQGKRYLKLAYSYLLWEESEWAEIYLDKSAKCIDKSDKYWMAAIYEGYGFLYKSLGNNKDAIKYFKKAYCVYKDLVFQAGNSAELIAVKLNSEYGVDVPKKCMKTKCECIIRIIKECCENEEIEHGVIYDKHRGWKINSHSDLRLNESNGDDKLDKIESKIKDAKRDFYKYKIESNTEDAEVGNEDDNEDEIFKK